MTRFKRRFVAAMGRRCLVLLLAGFSLVSAGRPSPSAAVQAAQDQLQAAAKTDEEAADKSGCFCQTNLAAKQQTVENMQEQLTQLSHDIDQSTARNSQLDIEIKMHKDELDTSTSALATANALREKDLAKFQDESQGHTQSIDQLQQALSALSFSQLSSSIALTKHRALIAVRKVARRVTGGMQRKQLLRFQRSLGGKSDPAVVSGVLKQMVGTFSRDLQGLKDDEIQAKNRHEGIVSAKTQEIMSQKKGMLGKQQRLAKSKVTLGFNKQINERSGPLLDANIALLNTLKQVCKRSEDSFTARRDAVQAEIEALSASQAALAGASFLSVGGREQGDGVEKLCAASIEIQEQSWKKQAQAACKQARQGSKPAAADAVESLESDIREAQDEAARKQDDCMRDVQGAQNAASNAASQQSAEANFVGSEQQSSEEQLRELTSQSENADKSKAAYGEVVAAQQKAAQAFRVATSQGQESLKNAAGRAAVPAASKINEAISQSQKLQTEADNFVGGLDAQAQELSGECDAVRAAAGKVMIPLRLMRADSEEDAIAIKENGDARIHAMSPKCDAGALGAEVAKLKGYRSMLGKAAEGLAWESLR